MNFISNMGGTYSITLNVKGNGDVEAIYRSSFPGQMKYVGDLTPIAQ